MKYLFRVAMLGCVITVLLSALSLQTAEAKVPTGRLRGAYLIGAAAVSPTDVWAVGEYFKNHIGRTLIEHWNGTQWSIVPSPSPGSYLNDLTGVTAVSATDVWAVGEYYNGDGTNGTLIEQWNGTQWSIVPSPNPGSYPVSLSGVAAVSATDVWAVGSYYDNYNHTDGTLIEQWNGTQWSVVPSPNPGQGGFLNGVTAVSVTDVWAVGEYYNSGNIGETLIEQWNGTQWSAVSSPSPGSSENPLNGVAAVSPTDVWAVGDYGNYGYAGETLIEQWNGTQWSVVPSPSPSPGQGDYLYGVTAVSATDVWAVGENATGTLIEQWNGTQWSVVPSPNPSSVAYLNGVTAVSATDIWTVGDSGSKQGHTLTEHWNGSTWSVVKSPSPRG